MVVLSVFDGMSCGQIALNRAGIPIEKYYASEVDNYAIQISKKNYPGTIQLGDITKIKGKNFFLNEIDLLIGGSPCQGFSFAGKQLNFDDPRSKLFFEYVRLVKELKPKYFLLENVKMKKEFQDIISEHLGVEPIEINSALVSAQNRKRLYWCNWSVEMPVDKEIFLKDIVLSDVLPVVLHNLYGGFKEKAVRVFENKTPTLRTAAGGGHVPHFVKKGNKELEKVLTFTERRTEEAKRIRRESQKTGKDFSPRRMKEVVPRLDGKSNCLTSALTIEHLVLTKKALKYMGKKVKGGRSHWDFKHHSDIKNEKSSAVVANFFKGVPYNVFKDWDCIRKFHPIECERLQTVPDNYTDGVSNTQRYKMLGNGFTVDVIAHILKQIKKEGK